MADRGRFFRGSELPRLLLLLGLAAAGWAWIWITWGAPRDAEEGPVPVSGPPAPILPDTSEAFAGVTDRTALGLLDNPAYAALLERSRSKSPTAMAAEARRDVGFTHLWGRPEHYRGVPIHILGAARRVLRYDSKLAPGGWLYEAWITTPESQNHPYVCVFEDAPEGLPLGDEIAERVVFNGYFLKLMRYQAGDTVRAAPLLVGKIGWTPRPAGGPWSLRSTAGVAIVMGCLLTLSLIRWLFYLRRSAASPSRPSIKIDRPTDVIDPDDLAAWVEDVADETERLRALGQPPEEQERRP